MRPNELLRRVIEVPITQEMYDNAKNRADEAGKMNQYSFMGGKSNIIGFLGEEAFHAAYTDSIWGSGIQYDFRYRGYTVEVKTKYSTTFPEDRWEASVTDTPPVINQKVDLYCFVRLYDNRCSKNHSFQRYPKAWICAVYPKETYFRKASHRKKGELDPSNNNIAKYSCFNMFYKDMHSPATLYELPEKNILTNNKLNSHNLILAK